MPNARRDAVRHLLDRTIRSEYGRIVSVVSCVLGSIEAAEDVVQSACARALTEWPARGIPRAPGAWLTTVSRRIALDTLRRRKTAERASRRVRANEAAGFDPVSGRSRGPTDPYELLAEWPDERLKLLFACCHPRLDPNARIALTLQVVSGLTAERIAGAFLVSPATMSQRLVRAKRRLREEKRPFDIPEPDRFPERLTDVLGAIYLIFNEGYLSHAGDALMQTELCEEAISLARTVVALLDTQQQKPNPEALGLLALLILIHARREARVDQEGVPVLLEGQDRSLWRKEEAAEGRAVLDRAVSLRRPGPYQIKAAINVIHHDAASPEQTDWQEICALYDRLLLFEPTSVVRLNRAVAIGMFRGAEAALREIAEIEAHGALRSYTYLELAKARYLSELGRGNAAKDALNRARALSSNAAEQKLIEARLRDTAQ